MEEDNLCWCGEEKDASGLCTDCDYCRFCDYPNYDCQCGNCEICGDYLDDDGLCEECDSEDE